MIVTGYPIHGFYDCSGMVHYNRRYENSTSGIGTRNNGASIVVAGRHHSVAKFSPFISTMLRAKPFQCFFFCYFWYYIIVSLIFNNHIKIGK